MGLVHLGADVLAVGLVGMVGGFTGQQGNGRRAGGFANGVVAQTGALTLADGDTALQVGELEVGGAVASEVGSQQREERRILRDRQDLALS